MKTFNTFAFALCFGGILATGCAQDDGTATSSAAVSAGPQAHALGVDQYLVRMNPGADGNHVIVQALAADGSQLGEVRTYTQASGAHVVRIATDGTVTEIVHSAEGVTILRDGMLAYSLAQSQIAAANGFADFEATAHPIPSDLMAAVALGAATITDQQLVDYVASVTPAGVAYAVPDCPWYFTVVSCIGWETGVGAVMCAACVASYLL